MEKVRTYLFSGFLIALPSAYGLYTLFTKTLPYLRERWIMFVLIITTVTGLMLPIFAGLNKYFFSIRKIIPRTVIRESLASGIICAVLLWFQIGRILNPTIVFLFVGGFAVVEVLMRTRDSVDLKGMTEKKEKPEE